ncbi:putative membrane protein, partial [Pseudomonas sp. FEN]
VLPDSGRRAGVVSPAVHSVRAVWRAAGAQMAPAGLAAPARRELGRGRRSLAPGVPTDPLGKPLSPGRRTRRLWRGFHRALPDSADLPRRADANDTAGPGRPGAAAQPHGVPAPVHNPRPESRPL